MLMVVQSRMERSLFMDPISCFLSTLVTVMSLPSTWPRVLWFLFNSALNNHLSTSEPSCTFSILWQKSSHFQNWQNHRDHLRCTFTTLMLHVQHKNRSPCTCSSLTLPLCHSQDVLLSLSLSTSREKPTQRVHYCVQKVLSPLFQMQLFHHSMIRDSFTNMSLLTSLTTTLLSILTPFPLSWRQLLTSKWFSLTTLSHLCSTLLFSTEIPTMWLFLALPWRQRRTIKWMHHPSSTDIFSREITVWSSRTLVLISPNLALIQEDPSASPLISISSSSLSLILNPSSHPSPHHQPTTSPQQMISPSISISPHLCTQERVCW